MARGRTTGGGYAVGRDFERHLGAYPQPAKCTIGDHSANSTAPGSSRRKRAPRASSKARPEEQVRGRDRAQLGKNRVGNFGIRKGYNSICYILYTKRRGIKRRGIRM